MESPTTRKDKMLFLPGKKRIPAKALYSFPIWALTERKGFNADSRNSFLPLVIREIPDEASRNLILYRKPAEIMDR